MSSGIIPSWNFQGILPPVDPHRPASRSNRSPYKISLEDLLLRFGASSDRLKILNGLLSFRSSLHGIGLIKGFQWLDGSFAEDCETLRSRPPNDIDVVTFYYLPEGQTQEMLFGGNPQIFDHERIKADYHVDAFFVELSGYEPEWLVSDSVYWYGVWSHQRNSLHWKGYLQVDLSPTDDHIATDSVKRMIDQGGMS